MPKKLLLLVPLFAGLPLFLTGALRRPRLPLFPRLPARRLPPLPVWPARPATAARARRGRLADRRHRPPRSGKARLAAVDAVAADARGRDRVRVPRDPPTRPEALCPARAHRAHRRDAWPLDGGQRRPRLGTRRAGGRRRADGDEPAAGAAARARSTGAAAGRCHAARAGMWRSAPAARGPACRAAR